MIELLFLLASAFSIAVICRRPIPLGRALPVPGAGFHPFSASLSPDRETHLRGGLNDWCVFTVTEMKPLSVKRLTGFSLRPTEERLSSWPTSC